MNRRQAKKAYKKKYGHNPPKTRVRLYASKEWRRILNEVIEGATRAMQVMAKAAKELSSSIRNMTDEVIEHIKTMSDEDFDELMKRVDLSAEAKAIAWRIRIADVKKE